MIVTVKSTNTIYVFPRDDDGRPLTPTVYQSSGPNQPTYFGFSFDKNGNLLVSRGFRREPHDSRARCGLGFVLRDRQADWHVDSDQRKHPKWADHSLLGGRRSCE